MSHSLSRSKSGSREDRRSPGSARQSSSYSAHYSDFAGADEMSGDIAIEADCDFDGGQIDVDDEDLNAAFEAEHGGMFRVIDEVGEERREVHASRERDEGKKKYVIPKIKQPENELQYPEYDTSYGSGGEGKHDWHKSDRDNRSRDHESRRKDRGDGEAAKRERDRREQETRWRDGQDSRGERGRYHGETKDGQDSRGERGRYHGETKDGQDSRAERGRYHGETKRQSQNGQSTGKTSAPEERQSLFESFAQQGLIADDLRTATVQSSPEATSEKETTIKSSSQLPEEEEAGLMIPLGRDSLVFVRDYHSWQVRVHPVWKTDMARTDFAQMWGMADSSSIVWSTHKDFGGVAEFLLKDYNSIQKFMRKILWHNFTSDILTVEVTERQKSDFSQQDANDTFDTIANKMTFKFHNSRARQLIKTYYPTPQGEVTDRSVYVNNINSGKAVGLLKAVFPCSSKISVARSTAESSSALVETSSVEETFNYLVVYDHININNCDVILSSVNNDWKGAKEKYEKAAGKKEADTKQTTDNSKPSVQKSPETSSGKRPAETTGKRPGEARGGGPAKRGKGPTNPARSQGSARGRGAASRGGASRGRGRGGASTRGRLPGRPLLPDPNTPKRGGEGLLPLPVPPPPEPMMGMGDSLLPRPDLMPPPGPPGLPPPPPPPPSLLSVPVNPTPKGLIEGEMLGPPETDFRAMELKEIRQELETRVQETRAQLETHLSKLDQTYRTGLPPKPRRPMDYLEEENRAREAPRRGLLPIEGRPRTDREEWLEETAEYRRPRPVPPPPPPPPAMKLERGYETGSSYSSFSRARRDEDYADVGQTRPRPYLLEAPPEQASVHEEPEKREVFDYEHARRRTRVEPELYRDERMPLPSRPAALERDRRDYPAEQSYASRDRYSYEEVEARRLASYRGYEEDSRLVGAPRYKDDYDPRY